jgi:hypothetical protein
MPPSLTLIHSLAVRVGLGPGLVSVSEPHVCHPGAEQSAVNTEVHSFFVLSLTILR